VKRKWLWTAATSLLAASGLLGWAAWERGEVELYLFLIFPVLRFEGAFGAASLLLGFAALVVLIFVVWTGPMMDGPSTAVKGSAAGVIMIGPLPIVLGNDRRTVLLALVITVIVLMTIMTLLLFQ